MKIGITGGTGFIGSHLIEYLLDRGFDIDCLALTQDIPGWLTANKHLSFIEGNLLEKESLYDFAERNDVIIHLAGLTRAASEEEFMSFNFQGTKNLIEAVKLNNPNISQLIIMSSQAAVGPSPDGNLLDEDALLNPISPYGKSKAFVEKFIKKECRELPITIIRAPSVYGPRDRDFIELVRLVKRRIKPILGKKTKLSFVYVKNLVQGIHLTINNPQALGEAFFITDDGAYSWAEFGSFMEKSLGLKALTVYIPKFAVIIVSLLSRCYAFFTKKQILLTKHKLREINSPFWTISNSKARKILGFIPATSTGQAMHETVLWYQSEGWC